MREISKIIIHCSATPEGRPHTVKDIDQWHRQQGYAQIGYHYVIYLDGSVHKGREESMIGAHCYGQNARSIGICYIGGMTADMKQAKDTRTLEQIEAMRSLVTELKSKYQKATIHGHNEFSAKDCPSFNVKNNL